MSSVSEVINGNVLIAEFMGTVVDKESYSAGGHKTVSYKMPDGKILYGSEFMYHGDWNWIMPVYLKAKEVIKTKMIKFKHIHTGRLAVREAGELILEGKCLEASEKLVEAIEWYNKTKDK